MSLRCKRAIPSFGVSICASYPTTAASAFSFNVKQMAAFNPSGFASRFQDLMASAGMQVVLRPMRACPEYELGMGNLMTLSEDSDFRATSTLTEISDRIGRCEGGK